MAVKTGDRSPELIPVLGSQPWGDRSHKPSNFHQTHSNLPSCSSGGTKSYWLVTKGTQKRTRPGCWLLEVQRVNCTPHYMESLSLSLSLSETAGDPAEPTWPWKNGQLIKSQTDRKQTANNTNNNTCDIYDKQEECKQKDLWCNVATTRTLPVDEHH